MKFNTREITKLWLDKLWNVYLARVNYAQIYVDLVSQKGGKLVNDHIALRTFKTKTGEQPGGIRAIKHILNFLDYKPAENYTFKKKKLTATHFEHSDPLFPKIFVSQLEVELLPEWAQKIINRAVKETPYILTDQTLELLQKLKEKGELPAEAAEYLADDLVQYFRRPWNVPQKDEVLKVNDVSQYAAWTLLHGNSVNHFTAFINYQEVSEWPDLEATCKGLESNGVPMKDRIEGVKGSKLQQSATLAVKEEVDVMGENGPEKMVWTYAYYELAQRDYIVVDGKKKLFSGFLGEQANHLFELTQTRDN